MGNGYYKNFKKNCLLKLVNFPFVGSRILNSQLNQVNKYWATSLKLYQQFSIKTTHLKHIINLPSLRQIHHCAGCTIIIGTNGKKKKNIVENKTERHAGRPI